MNHNGKMLVAFGNYALRSDYEHYHFGGSPQLASISIIILKTLLKGLKTCSNSERHAQTLVVT